MIELYSYNKKLVKKGIITKQLLRLLLRSKKTCWIDLIGYSQNEIDLLQKEIPIHHLIVEDIVSGSVRPKVESFKNHDFIVFYGINMDSQQIVSLPQLNFVIGQNFLITFHKQKIASFEALKKDTLLLSHLLQKGSDLLFHKLIDMEVDNYFPIFDAIEQEIDILQDSILEDPKPEKLQKLFYFKKQITHVRRVINPEREMILSLSKPHIKYIRSELDLYFRDVQEHLLHIGDRIDTDRDILTTMIDLHISVTNNKLNEIMKLLTVFATTMIPLTVIGSIYGMNFRYMPELEWKYGYLGVWIVMFLVVVIILSLFRRKKWI